MKDKIIVLAGNGGDASLRGRPMGRVLTPLGLMGARWMDLAAGTDPAQARHWLELWASEKYTLSRSLPNLHWGQLPSGRSPPAEKIMAIKAEIDAAITIPALPASPD